MVPFFMVPFFFKALKLYLFSFRNHGDFHEDCVQKICNDLVKIMEPKFIEVVGEFTPRGGIAIFPYSAYAQSEKKYQDIYQSRFSNFTPGKYSLQLGRPY
jgi:7-cyano-7-deazaguanine reductase